MDCPSRTDVEYKHEGWNQNPPSLSGNMTTREDLNGIANLRFHRDRISLTDRSAPDGGCYADQSRLVTDKTMEPPAVKNQDKNVTCLVSRGKTEVGTVRQLGKVLVKFSRFIGPGFMVSVAYIDPGNYSTDVGLYSSIIAVAIVSLGRLLIAKTVFRIAAGASTRFKLLFIVLMSNIFAVVLQSLAVRLGTVTGLNLAEQCRAQLPRWLNISLYIMAETAIIATDIAEVIGSAIALNLLLKIPLVAGCALTIIDVLIILVFYTPKGSLRRLRFFEFFVVALVLGVVICFCIQLSFVAETSAGEVFRGYIPSAAIVRGQGLYLSCGILGATVMPHSLYLGSGIVQARLKDFDKNLTNSTTVELTIEKRGEGEDIAYRPSLAAIKSCLAYSVVELALSLSIFALFVNSAILIVAGAALSSTPAAETADLFGIHDLLSNTLAPVAGTIFALALLLSGTSAGIICTIAGQLVSEGSLKWTVAPWLRRLITRSISITPSIIIAGAVGRNGLSAALNGTQVALSIILPFVSAPLIYFTCRNRYMTVSTGTMDDGIPAEMKMRNHWILSGSAVLVWLVITVMDVALIVMIAEGKA